MGQLQTRRVPRTIVIFTSDNGGERVPAFVRWPGMVPAGVSTDQVATTLDWTATMLAAARVAVLPDWMASICVRTSEERRRRRSEP